MKEFEYTNQNEMQANKGIVHPGLMLNTGILQWSKTFTCSLANSGTLGPIDLIFFNMKILCHSLWWKFCVEEWLLQQKLAQQ